MAMDNMETDIIIKIILHIYMLMPILGIIGALSFERKDITLFLKWFEKLCKGHEITMVREN